MDRASSFNALGSCFEPYYICEKYHFFMQMFRGSSELGATLSSNILLVDRGGVNKKSLDKKNTYGVLPPSLETLKLLPN